MSNSEQLNSELTNTLEYIIDKFNLTLEVSSEQIKEFSVQISKKIITWEFMTSIIAIVFCILVIFAAIQLHKHFKIESFTKLCKIYNTLLEDSNNVEEVHKLIIKIVIKIVIVLVSLFFASFILCELKDIIMCIIFPEKVILEFISSYL